MEGLVGALVLLALLFAGKRKRTTVDDVEAGETAVVDDVEAGETAVKSERKKQDELFDEMRRKHEEAKRAAANAIRPPGHRNPWENE